MKLKYTFIISVTLLVLIIVYYLSFPLGGKLNNRKSVKIYYIDNISVAHQHIIDLFNKEYSGKIEVVPIDIPFYKFSTNERKELLMRALRSESERIDVFAADIIWLKRFAKWAEPIDKYFPPKEKSKLTSKALSTSTLNEKLYAVPIYLDISVMFYRDDLLRKFHDYKKLEKKIVGSLTWHDFIQLGKKSNLKERFYVYPADEYEGLICSFAELIIDQNYDFFANKFRFSDKISVKSAKLLSDLVNKYKISPKNIINYREKNAYEDFITNDALFLRGWQSFKKDTKNLNKSKTKDKFIKEARLPHFKGSKIGATIGGWNLMLAKNSKHKKEAIKFMKFILKEKSQKILYEQGSYLPVIKSLYADSMFITKHPDLVFDGKLLEEGVLRPRLKLYTRISDILSHYLRLAIAGKISPEQAMKNTDTDLIKLKDKD